MNQQLSEEILKRIDALAGKLGTTGAHLWEVLVRQAKITAITDLFLSAFLISGVCACIYAIRWIWRSDSDFADEAGPAVIILLGLGGIIMLICAAGTLIAVPSEFANPEYWALKEVLGKLK